MLLAAGTASHRVALSFALIATVLSPLTDAITIASARITIVREPSDRFYYCPVSRMTVFRSYTHDRPPKSILPQRVISDEPRNRINVTAVVGQMIILRCEMNAAGDYKTVWVSPTSVPLTMDSLRLVDDTRFGVEHETRGQWNLVIRDVEYGDSGEYRCTANIPPKSVTKYVNLAVKVPPTIVYGSANEVSVEEGQTVELFCNATGVPPPIVEWYRININVGYRDRIGTHGETLVIHNATRQCDDIYECMATNGVYTAVSRRIRVNVRYPPEIELKTRRIGQSLGKDTEFSCTISANPLNKFHWIKAGMVIAGDTAKYQVKKYIRSETVIDLSLRVRSIDSWDYGNYVCHAENDYGVADSTVNLHNVTTIVFDNPWSGGYVPPGDVKPMTITAEPATKRPPSGPNDNVLYVATRDEDDGNVVFGVGRKVFEVISMSKRSDAWQPTQLLSETPPRPLALRDDDHADDPTKTIRLVAKQEEHHEHNKLETKMKPPPANNSNKSVLVFLVAVFAVMSAALGACLLIVMINDECCCFGACGSRHESSRSRSTHIA